MKTRIEIQNVPITYSGVSSSQFRPTRSDSADAMAVAVAYADKATRERAMLLCDHLVDKLWQDVDFEITWWKFDYLNDQRIASDAADAARQADMVIFSAEADRELTPAVQGWIESWAARRESREGALVALIGNDNGPANGTGPVHIYLRGVARRAEMDYLSNLPDSLSEQVSGSVQSISPRSAPAPSTLDRIYQRASPYSHWGIHE